MQHDMSPSEQNQISATRERCYSYLARQDKHRLLVEELLGEVEVVLDTSQDAGVNTNHDIHGTLGNHNLETWDLAQCVRRELGILF